MIDATDRDAALKRMISKLNQGEERDYFLGLVGYFIEGIPYSASGLTVDSTGTLDIRLTEEGFSCTAFFPPNILHPTTVQKKGVIKRRFSGRWWKLSKFSSRSALRIFIQSLKTSVALTSGCTSTLNR